MGEDQNAARKNIKTGVRGVLLLPGLSLLQNRNKKMNKNVVDTKTLSQRTTTNNRKHKSVPKNLFQTATLRKKNTKIWPRTPNQAQQTNTNKKQKRTAFPPFHRGKAKYCNTTQQQREGKKKNYHQQYQQQSDPNVLIKKPNHDGLRFPQRLRKRKRERERDYKRRQRTKQSHRERGTRTQNTEGSGL